MARQDGIQEQQIMKAGRQVAECLLYRRLKQKNSQ